jgi:hypothetical protein
MFVKPVCGLGTPVLILLVCLILMAACGDGGDEAPTILADTPVADEVEASPSVTADSVIAVVTSYVTETGLDGETFEVTDPINCKAFPDVSGEDAPIGRVCIDFNSSEFGESSGVIEVWEYGTESTWRLTLELQDISWAVTGVEELTTEGDGE